MWWESVSLWWIFCVPRYVYRKSLLPSNRQVVKTTVWDIHSNSHVCIDIDRNTMYTQHVNHDYEQCVSILNGITSCFFLFEFFFWALQIFMFFFSSLTITTQHIRYFCSLTIHFSVVVVVFFCIGRKESRVKLVMADDDDTGHIMNWRSGWCYVRCNLRFCRFFLQVGYIYYKSYRADDDFLALEKLTLLSLNVFYENLDQSERGREWNGNRYRVTESMNLYSHENHIKH